MSETMATETGENNPASLIGLIDLDQKVSMATLNSGTLIHGVLSDRHPAPSQEVKSSQLHHTRSN